MESLKRFFLRIRDSFYNPAEYAATRAKSLGGLLGFVFLVSLLASAVIAIPFGIAIATAVNEAGSATFVADHYPEGLEVTIKDGVASTNQTEPYFIPVPEEDRPEGGFQYFLVIDTRPDLTLETIESYDSAAILTHTSLIVQGEDDRRSLPLDNFGNVTVTEAAAEEWYGAVIDIVKTLIVPFAVLLIPFLAAFILAGHAFASLVGALLALGIGAMRGVKMPYPESYKVALLGSVPIIVFSTFAHLAGFVAVPFWLTLLLFVTVVFVNLKKQEAAPTVLN